MENKEILLMAETLLWVEDIQAGNGADESQRFQLEIEGDKLKASWIRKSESGYEEETNSMVNPAEIASNTLDLNHTRFEATLKRDPKHYVLKKIQSFLEDTLKEADKELELIAI